MMMMMTKNKKIWKWFKGYIFYGDIDDDDKYFMMMR